MTLSLPSPAVVVCHDYVVHKSVKFSEKVQFFLGLKETATKYTVYLGEKEKFLNEVSLLIEPFSNFWPAVIIFFLECTKNREDVRATFFQDCGCCFRELFSKKKMCFY